jgi:hypothetical protein
MSASLEMPDKPPGWEKLAGAYGAHNSFGFIMRQLPEANGAVPYHSVAAGVCIHPRGVVLTCLHNIESFIKQLTPYTPDEAAEFYQRGKPLPVEDLESVYFGFQQDLTRSAVQVTKSGWRRRRMQVFKVHWCQGSRGSDLATLLIGPAEEYFPLPFVELFDGLPRRQQQVFFLGHYHPPFTPRDTRGHPSGLAVWYQVAQVVMIAEDFFLIDVPSVPGMSGGPVVDPDSGQVLGVICERWSPELTKQRVGIEAEVSLVVGYPYSLEKLTAAVDQLRF